MNSYSKTVYKTGLVENKSLGELHYLSDEQKKHLEKSKKHIIAPGVTLTALYCGVKYLKDWGSASHFDEKEECKDNYFPPLGQEDSYKDKVSTIIIEIDEKGDPKAKLPNDETPKTMVCF